MFTMLLAAVICAAVLQQDPLRATLSPEYRATRVPSMLRDLGEKAGINLEAEPRFTNEVLILRARAVTLRELMDRIADVCDAGWERTERGYLLKRPAYRQRELEALDRKLRADGIQKVLDAEAKTLAKWDTPEKRAGAWIEGYALARKKADQGDYEMLSNSSIYHPSHQFYLKLMTAIGAQKMAALPIGARIAIASPANVAQLPLPSAYSAILEEFKETAEAVPRLFENGGKEIPEPVAEWLKPYFKPLRIGKTIMAMTNEHWGTWGYMGVYDPEGRMVASSVGLRVSHMFPAEPFLPGRTLKPVPYGEAALELRSCYFDAAGNDEAVPMNKTMSRAGLERLLNPERYDPLAYQDSDAFLGLAEQSDRMLIGRLPDELWRSRPLAAKGETMKLEAVLSAAAQQGLVVKDKDGWLVLKLSNPAHFERTRLKRDSLGRFFRTSWAARAMSFEDACRYQFENDGNADNSGLGPSLRTVLIGLGVGPFKGPSGFMPPRLMAFLGSLGKEQWRILYSGEPLRLDTLSSVQKAVFAKVVPVATPSGKTWDEAGTPAIMAHPSESIPFGPGKETFIKFVRAKQWVVKGIGEGAAANLAMDAENCGYWLASMAQGAGMNDFVQFLPKEIALGSRTRYNWEIQLVPGIVYGPADFFSTAVMEPKKRSFADFPEEFRNEIRKEFEKQLAEWKGG